MSTPSQYATHSHYKNILPVLNQLLTTDQQLQNNLAKARVGALPHYDNIIDNTNTLLTTLTGLQHQYQDLKSNENRLIGSKLVELQGVLSQYLQTIEQLKSDLAITRNSINYLPLLILELQSLNANLLSHTDSLAAHKDMVALLELHSYSDDSRWFNDFTEALNKVRRNETPQTKIYTDQIEKHIFNIKTYRPRIVKNFLIINDQKFSHSIQRLVTLIIDFDNQKLLSFERLQFILLMAVLASSVLALFALYRSSIRGLKLKAENAQRSRINNTLSQLAKFDNRRPKEEFLDHCTANLISLAGSYCAAISFFEPNKDNEQNTIQLKTASFNMLGEKKPNVTYQPKGTPCQDVITNHLCVVEANVAKLYPSDEMLTDFGIEAYFGQVILNAKGSPIGLLALNYQHPMKYEPWLQSLMEIFATRISIEVERNEASTALLKEHNEAVTTLNAIADCVIRIDSDGIINNINPVACQLFEIKHPNDVIGSHISALTSPSKDSDADPIADLVLHCISQKSTTSNRLEATISPQHSSKQYTVRVSVAPMLDNDFNALGAILVMTDVTHESKYRDELTYQANHDSLTGLYNRRALNTHLQKRMQRSSKSNPCGLIYIDMDRFKVVNDTCGHAAGDALLRQFSLLLSRHIMPTDLLARLGGDEFFICLENCDQPTTTSIANKILEKVQAFRFFWKDNEFEISISIGLTVVDSSLYDQAQAISAVDLACLKAKKNGRNQLCSTLMDSPDISSQKSQGLWIQRLNQAISYDQFELHQQPIVNADTPLGEPNQNLYQHVEILLRLPDESGENLMPHEFLAAAERYELMPRIDRWVVKNVLARMAGEIEKTSLMHADFVAINLSGQSLANKDLLNDILNTIDLYTIDPQRLCFEITETEAIANLDNAIHLVQELRSIGCKIALDDFGSGLSSYEYIKKLPIDFLKIDREFTKQVENDHVNQVILQSIINVAHGLGMQAIAEGIEDLTSYNVVKDMGVNYLQGYAIARPKAIAVSSKC